MGVPASERVGESEGQSPSGKSGPSATRLRGVHRSARTVMAIASSYRFFEQKGIPFTTPTASRTTGNPSI